MKLFNKSYFVIDDTLPVLDIEDSHLRFPFQLAEMVIKSFSKKGDCILDPMAGFGTTLFAANKLRRKAFGFELLKVRYEYVNKNILLGNSKIFNDNNININNYILPKFSLVFTSPNWAHCDNNNYNEYLNQLSLIFNKIKNYLYEDAYIIIEAGNTFNMKTGLFCPFAWDLARHLQRYFYFERELIRLDKYGKLKNNEANHSYLLIFRNR